MVIASPIRQASRSMCRSSRGNRSLYTTEEDVIQEATRRGGHVVKDVLQKTPPETWSILAGTVAFGSALALSTWTQQRIFRISTGSVAPIPSMVGFATVCVASLAAHKAATVAYQCNHVLGADVLSSMPHQARQAWDRIRAGSFWEDVPSLREIKRKAGALVSHKPYNDEYLDCKIVNPMHAVRICAIGLLAFKVLGGRFWAIAPSSYTHLGSFARPRRSLPATLNYASPAKRAVLERLGRSVGCHTCGTRRIGASLSQYLFFWKRWVSDAATQRTYHFVGDHMPPKSVAQQINNRFYRRFLRLPDVEFRFYPQCVDCSAKQAGLLSAATNKLRNQSKLFRRTYLFPPSLATAGGGTNSHFHGLRPRWNHWAGGVVGGVAVTGASSYDILDDDNRSRYRKYQRQMEQWTRQTFQRVWSKLPFWDW